jgi:hypothetical protein
MGGKWKPRQLQEIKPRSKVARAMIEGGTGKGGPMRDRRERRPKERDDDLSSLQAEELFYDAQETDG